MTRGRLLAAVAALLVVVAVAGAAAVVLTRRGPAGSATATAVEAPPPAVVVKALVALTQPVGARPLDGSVARPLAGTYGTSQSCDAVRAAYKAPNAPIAAQSTVADGPDGSLLITGAFGTVQAVFTVPAGSGCDYAIATQPTVEVSGQGPVPVGNHWGPVGCDNPATGGQLDLVTFADTGPRVTILVGPSQNAGSNPPPTSYRAIISPESLDQLGADAKKGKNPSGTTVPATMGSTADGRVTVTLGGGGNGQVITLGCTVLFGELMTFPG